MRGIHKIRMLYLSLGSRGDLEKLLMTVEACPYKDTSAAAGDKNRC